MRFPDGVSDAELLLNSTWPMKSGVPVREAVEYLEYGKANYVILERIVALEYVDSNKQIDSSI